MDEKEQERATSVGLASTLSIPEKMTIEEIRKELFKIKARVPRDKKDDRYIMSFPLEQEDEIRRFFDDFGFVVIENVLSPGDCQECLDDLFGMLERTSDYRRNEPKTWHKWPKKGHATFGVPQLLSHFTPTLLKMRAKETTRHAFALLHGTDDLVCSNDRYLLGRPTKHPGLGPNGRKDFQRKPSMHIDLQPWIFMGKNDRKYRVPNYRSPKDWIHENNICYQSQGRHLQGIMNLTDSRDEVDGGNLQLAGFVHYFKQFWSNLKDPGDTSGSLKLDKDPWQWVEECATHVTMRPGSIVIWDNMQVHGGKDNQGTRFRAVFALKMTPRSYFTKQQLLDREAAFPRQCKKWETGAYDDAVLSYQRSKGLAREREQIYQQNRTKKQQRQDRKAAKRARREAKLKLSDKVEELIGLLRHGSS